MIDIICFLQSNIIISLVYFTIYAPIINFGPRVGHVNIVPGEN